MSPDKKKKRKLLYVSDEGQSIIEIFSVPKYKMVGEITSGLNEPEGIATDKKGNLYVSNLGANTVTVYKPGKTIPSLTLTESNGPDDVAVGSNGYVYAADVAGGIDVYPPGATSPSNRLTNSYLSSGALGVGVDASNNVYASGVGPYGAAVVEFANASGSGTNLNLSGLEAPAGVLIDNNNDVVVSDFFVGAILIYPPGQTSPSSTISVSSPERSGINKAENEIYPPEANNYAVGVYDYPSGNLVTTISIGSFTAGTALSPAPVP
jgi:sugar lactone lactonase YvrE